MTTPSWLPAGTPPSIGNLAQNNALVRAASDSLRPNARYREDAVRQELASGMGATATFSRVGLVDVDLKPAPLAGSPDYGQFEAEQYTANPKPYAKSFRISALQGYGQTAGNHEIQVLTRAAEWAGRTSSRLARGRFLHFLGGQAIIRRAQSSGDSVLLVNSLAGFRFKHVNGVPQAVSSTNKLPVTIKAGSTITSLSVTGVTPLDPNFPDGPGELTLDSTFGASVAANSYVFVQGLDSATPRTFIVRSGGRASTEALLSTDIPTLNDVIAMKAKLVDRGIPPHADGTYHLHVDATFTAAAVQDVAWRQAFQGAGISPILGPGAFYMPQQGITVVENNDSPARGRGKEVIVGASGFSGSGGTGTPGSSVSMQDVGFDLVNSSGVYIRRALMCGGESMIESFIDHRKVMQLGGVRFIHDVGDVQVADLNGMRFLVANVMGWVVMIRPAIDERALESTLTVVNYLDFVLPTDINAGTDSSGAPLKRAVWLEYGSTT